MTLLNVTSAQLAENGGTITCNHCQRRFTATGTTDLSTHASILDDQAQASLFEEALQPRQRSNRPPLRWIIVSLLLALLLAGQATYFMRNELAARYNVMRPWLQTFCNALGCELTPLRDLSQLHIISREVRSHPSIKNTLQISLAIRNTAPFRQPWPTLQLAFSDINGQTIARRSFAPADYLPAGSPLADGMPSQTPIYTNLVLVDPGEKAVNFIFEFK